ncbi:MAG: glycoside hydrolase family 28 protein [Tepidisphaerales bacterium]
MAKIARFLTGLLMLCMAVFAHADAPVFDVRQHGALGDGKTPDTAAINKAVIACASAGGGQVKFPPGKYLTGTINLASNITLQLDAGAEIIGTADLDRYQNFNPPGSTPLAGRNRWHRALVLGVGVENVAIMGPGTINGNKVFDATGEEKMRGPHAVLFGNSKGITLRDVSIKDAANYAVMLEFTSQVEVRGVKITGGWDGVHFRGWKDNPCRDVSITNCEFYTGDDCIAGWFWENTLIANCIINSSCNGIRLIGPAKGVIIDNCLFFGPGRFEHRTSRDKHRTNMLAGLCLQPGAWDKTEGPMDDVAISNITMHNVTTPLHLSLKPGNVGGRVTIDRMTATGCYLAAASIESWAATPIEHVTLRDVNLSFTGGGTAEQAKLVVKSPPVDARPLPAWGLYARNVKHLDLQNVRLTLDAADARPMAICDGVDRLTLDTFKFLRTTELPFAFTGVNDVRLSDTNLPTAPAKCVDLKFDATTVTATVEAPQDGLAKVDLTYGGNPLTRWTYLKSGEKKDVLFANLPALPPGKHGLRCGDVSREVTRP